MLDAQSEEHSCDEHWRLWMHKLQEVGQSFFRRDGKPLHRDDLYVGLEEHRQSLLAKLGELRTMCAALSPTPKPGVSLWTPEQQLEPIKAELATVQKSMRALRRQAEGGRKRTLEDELELARKHGRRAEAQKLVRLLARRSRGTAMRRLNALCVHKPTALEIRETAELDAAHGGLSAMIVNWEEQQRSWVEDETDPDRPACLLIMDLNIKENAKEDLKLVLQSLVKAQKRKVSPTWSAPTELLLLAL